MTFWEIIEDFEVDPRFWRLLIMYTILTPLWFYIAYACRHNKIEMLASISLGLIFAVKAVAKWRDIPQ